MQAKVKSEYSREVMQNIRETLAAAQSTHDKWAKAAILETEPPKPQSLDELKRQCLLVPQVRAIGRIRESCKVISGAVQSINQQLVANKLPVPPVNLASLHILVKGLDDVLFNSKAARGRLKDLTDEEEGLLNDEYFQSKG